MTFMLFTKAVAINGFVVPSSKFVIDVSGMGGEMKEAIGSSPLLLLEVIEGQWKEKRQQQEKYVCILPILVLKTSVKRHGMEWHPV